MTNRNSSRSAWTVRLLASTALGLILTNHACANPLDGTVAAGTATIVKTNPQTLTINQTTQKAVINWRSFTIGQGETTNFVQPSASAITLNRVTGVDPSSILGNLTANGQVWLINPNGIAFGKSARVDVAGLLATTIDIADRDFMSGNYRFSSLRNPSAMVSNAGQITVRNAGLAALVAPGVENSGLIQANLGQIQLSSAAAFTVDLYGDGLFNFTLDKQVTQAIKKPDGTKPTAAVSNSGQLIANGGRILLTANAAKSVVDHAINMDGYVQATSASVSATGEITLDGGAEGTVQVAGTLDASGKDAGRTGGTVKITGDDVQIASSGIVDASGDRGGGRVYVGGEMHGSGTLRHASTTSAVIGAKISADAISQGTGGTVVLWSSSKTDFQATLSARGGVSGGSGGTAEVSSEGVLNYSGLSDLRAPKGVFGSLLLDPENVTIADNGNQPDLPSSSGSPIVFNPTAQSSILSVSTLENALTLADVTVSTGSMGSQAGDITVAADISWEGYNSLTLSAHRNIIINGNIANAGWANVTLRADNLGTGVGTVIFSGSHSISILGTTAIYFNPSVNPAGSRVNPISYVDGQEDFASHVTGWHSKAYMLVNTVYDLQNVGNNTSGSYALGRDIEASATTSWNGGAGFLPIGGFSGYFNGLGHTINNLYINRPTTDSVGLFNNICCDAYSVHVQDFTLANVNIIGHDGVGALTGWNVAGVSSVHTIGTVKGNAVVGGLVAANDGEISNSSTSGTVSGNETVAGLVAFNRGSLGIDHSYSSANVSGTYFVGGLVAQNSGGTIADSYATGTVIGTGNVVGGLVGLSSPNSGPSGGTITNAYASGAVSGPNAGGLVGVSDATTFSAAYWDIQSTHQSTSAGGIGLTTAQLKSGLPMEFDPSTWAISSSINSGYPYLKWQIAEPGSSAITVNFSNVVIIPITWTIADATATYGNLAILGKVTLSGVLTEDVGLVTGTVGLFDGYSQVTLSPSLAVGTYAEKVTGLTGASANNYTLATTGNIFGTLTINPKTLTWTVSNRYSVFGSAPVLGNVTLTGKVGSDDVHGNVGLRTDYSNVFPSASILPGTYYEYVLSLFGNSASNYVLAQSGNTEGILTVARPNGLDQYQNSTTSSPSPGNFLGVPTDQLAVGPMFAIQGNPALRRASDIGWKFVETDPRIQEQMKSILVSLGAKAIGVGEVTDWILKMKEAWQLDQAWHDGTDPTVKLDTARLSLELFVKVFGTPAAGVPLDFGKLMAAIETEYWYGFNWALKNPNSVGPQ